MATACLGPHATQHFSGKKMVLKALSCSPNWLSPLMTTVLLDLVRTASWFNRIFIRWICRNFHVKFLIRLRRFLITAAGYRAVTRPISALDLGEFVDLTPIKPVGTPIPAGTPGASDAVYSERRIARSSCPRCRLRSRRRPLPLGCSGPRTPV